MRNRARAIWSTILLGLILWVYLSWLMNSTFLEDDLGQIPYASVPYTSQLNDWASLWGYRPISLLMLPALIHLFGTGWLPYAVLNSCLYSFAIWAYFWKYPAVNILGARILGTFLAATPAIASTVIFSPVNQFPATASLALAATGHLLANKVAPKESHLRKMSLTALFTASLLTYEIALPLIIWTCLKRVKLENDSPTFSKLRTTFSSLLPALTGILIAFSWQKIGAPQLLNSGFSRASGLSPYSLATFAYGLLVSLPGQLVRVVMSRVFEFVALSVFLCLGLRFLPGLQDEKASDRNPTLIGSIVISLLACAGLFLVSGAGADLTGYVNRGLTSTWFVMIFALLFLTFFALKEKLIGMLLIVCISAANFLWFVEKVYESNAASALRSQIVEKIVENADLLDQNQVLVADVPCLLPNSQSDIDIFCTEWDLKGALKLQGVEVKSVLPRWDWKFEELAATNLKESESGVYLAFSDQGYLLQVQDLRYGEKIPSLAGRGYGGKEFLARNCLENFVSRGTSQTQPPWTQCIINPY